MGFYIIGSRLRIRKLYGGVALQRIIFITEFTLPKSSRPEENSTIKFLLRKAEECSLDSKKINHIKLLVNEELYYDMDIVANKIPMDNASGDIKLILDIKKENTIEIIFEFINSLNDQLVLNQTITQHNLVDAT